MLGDVDARLYSHIHRTVKIIVMTATSLAFLLVFLLSVWLVEGVERESICKNARKNTIITRLASNYTDRFDLAEWLVRLTTNVNIATNVPDPWHFSVDPDPEIYGFLLFEGTFTSFFKYAFVLYLSNVCLKTLYGTYTATFQECFCIVSI
jgi:hypothetical protein